MVYPSAHKTNQCFTLYYVPLQFSNQKAKKIPLYFLYFYLETQSPSLIPSYPCLNIGYTNPHPCYLFSCLYQLAPCITLLVYIYRYWLCIYLYIKRKYMHKNLLFYLFITPFSHATAYTFFFIKNWIFDLAPANCLISKFLSCCFLTHTIA